MKKYSVLLIIFIFSLNIFAQTAQKQREKAVVLNANKTDSSALELAKATLAAHGGDKLIGVKSIVIRGSADLTAGASAQSIPAGFSIVTSGAKYRFDIQSPFFNFQQIFDGEQTFSSISGLNIPLNKSGLQILSKINSEGYTVSALPDKFKKKTGFRLTSPDGYSTDFIVDDKTKQVKEYEASYQIGNNLLTTSVAIDKYRDVEGILVNEKFSQRMETRQGTFYSSFKAKEILVNSPIDESVFIMK